MLHLHRKSSSRRGGHCGSKAHAMQWPGKGALQYPVVGRTVSTLRNEGCRGSTRRCPYRAVLLPVRAVSVTGQQLPVSHAPRPQALYPTSLSRKNRKRVPLGPGEAGKSASSCRPARSATTSGAAGGGDPGQAGAGGGPSLAISLPYERYAPG